MKVIISPELFASPIETLSLLVLFEHGWQGDHRIELDLEDPAIASWLALQPQDVREQCELAVDASAHDEAQSPSVISIMVVTGDRSDWSCEPARLSLADARILLRRSFEIHVEDDTSDRAFLCKMMTSEERQLIETLEKTDRLRFVHGGGSRLKTRIERRANEPEARLQTWVMFDSDAMRPGAASTHSDDVCAACEAASIPFHRLSRRFIESYLPLDALERWGKARPSKRQENLPIFRAFARLSPAQRDHFNMKKGFRADAARSEEVGDLYEGLDSGDRERLSRGFGEKIGDLFQDRYPGQSEGPSTTYVSERELRRDGGWDELRPAVRELLGYLGGS